MDFRDIIVWLGLIAIVVIIWDGIRRMKSTKVKPAEKLEPYIDPEEAARQAQIARELPNGGARVREMTDVEQEDIKTRLNLRERVPMLMERVEVESPESADDDQPEETAPAFQSELDFTTPPPATQEEPEFGKQDAVSFSEVNEPSMAVETSENSVDTEGEELHESAAVVDDTEGARIDSTAGDREPLEVSVLEAETTVPEVEEPQITEEPDKESKAEELGPVEDLVIIHVMAPKGAELSGSSVLDLLVTAGLRHGPMDIFHYRNPKGVTEFSLANCIQPGTFDPDAMNQVNTPGVTLFMQLPTGANAMEAFDHMVEMARFLAKHLEAEVLDEDHSTVTGQRIEYYREKIRSFERSKLIPSS
jgi:cell division protein ZipA